jgi:hypothetical protein
MLRTGITALLLLASSGAALAQDPQDTRGFYFGGGITQTRFDADNFSFEDVDDEDNSWKAIAGYRIAPPFAIEANYVDFGEARAAALVPGVPESRAEAKAIAAYAVGMVPLPWFDLYAKAGAAQIDAELTDAANAVARDDDTTEFAYGGGAQARFGNFALRAEYEKFDTDIIGDLDLISLSGTYTFAVDR